MPEHIPGNDPIGVTDQGRMVRAAAPAVGLASTAEKDDALVAAADLLLAHTEPILAANTEDLDAAAAAGTSATLLDRLRLDERRLDAMAGGLRQVAALPDPIGEIIDGWLRPNGLQIRRMRVPLGVVGIIYEMRPNVTSDAAGLCVKSGNAAFLRGSSAAIRSNRAIARSLREGMTKAGLPADAVTLVDDVSRAGAVEFMQQRGVIDCLIPRGGPSLIASVLEHATVPYVIDGSGNCHVYVDRSADLDDAVAIVRNGKCQRPSVCNATESLVVHADIAATFLPRVAAALDGVELRGDARTREILRSAGTATEADFGHEFLDLRLSVAVVDSVADAISHVNRFGTGHSEAIVTGELDAATRFAREVDAACVLVNVSTRFVDGEEFGFGAEIGISTQKLHARGPMGLRALTTTKYVVQGDGHVRL